MTDSDIAHGVPCNDNQCPVALAIKRQTREADVHVTYEGSIFVGNAFSYGSESVRRFINKFDRGEPVEPFRFDLRI